ncbi:MAG: hypothetical protein EPO07_05185 [Verrucomicrobia bacterium]|nr:MAG: hypothetical protein EPO07_05185 [Verrucomicrobiota bacterium]
MNSMKTTIRRILNNPTMRIRPLAIKLSVCLGLFVASTAFGTTRVWTNAVGDHLLLTSANWNPNGTPQANASDILTWDGSAAGPLILTNNQVGSFANLDNNPGAYINITAGQTSPLTLVETNGGTGRIRLNGGATRGAIAVASGAGAFSIGTGAGTAFPLALAGIGTGEVHRGTNDSANTVTLNSEVYYVMGGGGAHTLLLAGTGNWAVNSSLQAQNSGSSLGLNVSGSGTVSLVGAAVAGVTYSGSYGNVTVNSGTLRLGAGNAIGTGNTLVLNGGSLDSSVASLVNSGNNPQSWNGNFGFVGTQSLDLGLGTATMNANRIVTVNASTLTVGGVIAGSGFRLTKAGAGTLLVNGGNTYSGGTVISNGVLRLGSAAGIPSGSATASSVTIYGTLDLNGNSPVVSSLNGTGIVDTVSGGTTTLTVGANDAGGAFTGVIQNSAGSVALSKTGIGLVTLGGASTYSGGTTVGSGTLLVTNATGSGTGSGTVTVSSGATFGGTGSVGGSVDWQSGSAGSFTVTSVSSTNSTRLTVSGSAILNGNSVVVNVPGPVPLEAGVYTLMTYNQTGSSGSFNSTPSYTGLGVFPGTTSTVTNGNGQVVLVVASALTGTSSAWTNFGDGTWTTGANWSSNPSFPSGAGSSARLGYATAFTTITLDSSETVGGIIFTNPNSFRIVDAGGGQALTFDNSGGGAAAIASSGTTNAIDSAVSLAEILSVSANNGTAISLGGVVSGSGTMNVSGTGKVSLSGNNTYGPSAGSVGTTLSAAGTLELGHNNALGAGDLSVLASGSLRAAAALTTANNIIISNTVTASVDNNGNNVTLSGVISGDGALGKNGSGTLTLTAANTYTNGTSMSAGTIKLGNVSGVPGGAGLGNVNMGTNTTLDLNGFSPVLNGLNATPTTATVDSSSGGAVTLTLGSSGAFGTYNGSIKDGTAGLALVKDGAGTQTLAGTNTFTGGTTITAGTLRVGNGNTNTSGVGTIVGLGTGPVLDNSILEFSLNGTNTFTNTITGSGQVNTAFGNNILALVLTGNNTFTGDMNINSGALWIKSGSALGTGPKAVHVQQGTAGNSQFHLDGSAGNITTDPNIDVWLSNVNGALFNESGSNTIQGNIVLPFGGGAAYVKVNSGFLTLSGTCASDGTANGRTLQLGGVGDGLFSGVAADNAQTLGGVTKVDAGTWTLTGASTTVGTLTTSGGTLVLNGGWTGPAVINTNATLTGAGGATNVTVNAGGKFVPGAYGSVGSFSVSNALTMAGSVYVSLNRSLAQSNTVVAVGTSASASAGSSLIVSNLGPALVAGDKFQLFTQPVANGNLMTITSPAGVTLANTLSVDGSIRVVATNPTNITSTVSGSEITLSWPDDHTGWTLQSNVVSVVASNSWFELPPGNGSRATNAAVITIDPNQANVFFRLKLP